MAAEKQSNDSKRDKQTAAKKRVTKLAAPLQAQVAAPELVQLALADPAAVAPSVILALQRSHGNQTVQRLIAQSRAAHQAEAAREAEAVRETEAARAAESLQEAELAEVAEPAAPLKQVTHTVVRRPKLSGFAQTESVTPQPMAVDPSLTEVEGFASGLGQKVEDYVPPVAPPALPPDDNNDPRHKVGSPYRHLDGVSNRKTGSKYRFGPAADWADYVEKNALALKYVAEPDQKTSPEGGAS
jgi:hypothetical protein